MSLVYKSRLFGTDIEAVKFLNSLEARQEAEKHKDEKYDWHIYPFSYEIKSIYAMNNRVYIIWQEVVYGELDG